MLGCFYLPQRAGIYISSREESREQRSIDAQSVAWSVPLGLGLPLCNRVSVHFSQNAVSRPDMAVSLSRQVTSLPRLGQRAQGSARITLVLFFEPSC